MDWKYCLQSTVGWISRCKTHGCRGLSVLLVLLTGKFPSPCWPHCPNPHRFLLPNLGPPSSPGQDGKPNLTGPLPLLSLHLTPPWPHGPSHTTAFPKHFSRFLPSALSPEFLQPTCGEEERASSSTHPQQAVVLPSVCSGLGWGCRHSPHLLSQSSHSRCGWGGRSDHLLASPYQPLPASASAMPATSTQCPLCPLPHPSRPLVFMSWPHNILTWSCMLFYCFVLVADLICM